MRLLEFTLAAVAVTFVVLGGTAACNVERGAFIGGPAHEPAGLVFQESARPRAVQAPPVKRVGVESPRAHAARVCCARSGSTASVPGGGLSVV